MSEKIHFNDLGIISYDKALEIQNRIFNEKLKNKKKGIENSFDVLICEHPHVYTLGKSGN